MEIKMEAYTVAFSFFCALLVILHANAMMSSSETRKLVDVANKNGPYFGLVIPNLFEMDPLLNSEDYNSTGLTIGTSLINAGITTQLLLSHFDLERVVHYGIAGNANPSLNIGDVTIPHHWSHTALWNWQRYGEGPANKLTLEANGDYTREIGYLSFANFMIGRGGRNDNWLNNIWYQPEEVFREGGTPEEREHVFWVPVNPLFYHISQTLEDLKVEGCLNTTTCLTSRPKVVTVERGTSASISMYLDFIYNISLVDMESASVALVSCNSSNTCHGHFVVHPSMLSKSDWRIRDERVYYFI